jgi:hypothetical protein
MYVKSRGKVHYNGCWGETLGEAMAKDLARRKAGLARMRNRVEKHQPRVVDIQENGEFVTVQFIRSNGERVTAVYQRFGWNSAPRKLVDKLFGKPRAARLIAVGEQVSSPLPPDPEETPST